MDVGFHAEHGGNRVTQRFFNGGGWLAIAIVALLVGCGRSEYDQRLSHATEKWNKESPYTELYTPLEIPDSPFKIRIPKLFKTLYGPTSVHPDDCKDKEGQGQLIVPLRFHPPMVALPGNKICCETYLGVAPGDDDPYYGYLAAGPIRDAKAWGAKLAELSSQLKKAGLKVTDWSDIDENVAAVTFGDKKSKWRKLTAEGDQHFFGRSGAERRVQQLAGKLELYTSQIAVKDETYFIFVGCRISDRAAKKVKLSEPVATVIQTVEVTEMKPPPKENEKAKDGKKDVGNKEDGKKEDGRKEDAGKDKPIEK